MPKFFVGIDGTDSKKGGCTTWTMSRVIDDLETTFSDDIHFIDFPYLVRLNPNIPFKTRGNGSLAISFESSVKLDDLASVIIRRVKLDVENYNHHQAKDPCIVIFVDQQPDLNVYQHALQEFLNWKVVSKETEPDLVWPEPNHSQVGAIAACAFRQEDFTYELLVYRHPSCFGKPRVINPENIKKLAKKYSSTFSSFDFVQSRELIAPSSPDPVLFGIRGDDRSEILQFSKEVQLKEDPLSATLFKTNQGTNAHVSRCNNSLYPFSVYSGSLMVASRPLEHAGGHLSFSVSSNGSLQKVMVFEPTKNLRDVARELIPGDQIFLHGAVINDDHGLSIHAEYLSIIDLVTSIEVRAPLCDCGQRMTSAGYGKGYKCRECSTISYFGKKVEKPRSLFVGQKAFSSLSAQRHLTRPLSRFHRRKKSDSIPKSIDQFRFHYD